MANKKEIDKDLMYKKLMPSNFKSIRNTQRESSVTEAPAVEQVAESIPEPKDSPAKPALRNVNIPAMDSQKTELINLMENEVLEKFDSVMARFNCCKCDRCKKDIIAIALNKLPPKYTVLKKGEFVPDIDKQLSAQVLTAMIQAVLQVRSHPRH